MMIVSRSSMIGKLPAVEELYRLSASQG